MSWKTLQYNGCYDRFMRKEGRDKIVRAKTMAVIAKLRNAGRKAKFPLIDDITDYHGIFELRTTGKIAVRGIFFYNDPKKEIIFSSFHLKKKGKLPQSVFYKAQNLMEVYDGGHNGLSSLN